MMGNNTFDISLGDSSLFVLAIGKRRTKKELLTLPKGNIPIISARLDKPFGFIASDSFVCSNKKVVLWNIDSSRWDTLVLKEGQKFIPTDHCGYMKILSNNIVPDYVAYKLYEMGLHLGFTHEYRSSLANIKSISIPVPINEHGDFDVNMQINIAEKYQQCIDVRKKLCCTISELTSKRININSVFGFTRVCIGDFMTFAKGNAKYTERFCNKHKGEFPVYSAGTKLKTTIGHIDSFDYDRECLKITTNGYYAGTVEYLPKGKFSINGDAGILYLTNPQDVNKVDYRYLEYALQKAREQYGFNWDNKPDEKDIKSIEISIPVKGSVWDIVAQREIAQKYLMYKNTLLKLKSCVEGMDKMFIKVD